jgi:predicted dehydrogenase
MKKRNKIFKLGFIGGGSNSAVGYSHLIACQMDHRFKIVSACFNRDFKESEQTTLDWNLEDIKLFNNWSELLKFGKNDVDAVVVLTPTPTHHEIVLECIRLNIPVICEKPLTSNMEEAQEIYQLQEENNSFVAVTHNYTGYPMLRELKSMVETNKLGSISQIKIEMPQEGFARLDKDMKQPSPQDWRLKDGVIPNISLDLGTHLQHMIHYVTGQNPSHLIADHNTYGFFKNIIDDIHITAKYNNGMKSYMWISKSALGHRNGLKISIYGTKGSARWYQMEPEDLIFYDVHGDKHHIDRASNVVISSETRFNRFKVGHPAGFIEAFANIYIDIANKLEEYLTTGKADNEWTYGPKQSAIGINVFNAARLSNEKAAWIKVDI